MLLPDSTGGTPDAPDTLMKPTLHPLFEALLRPFRPVPRSLCCNARIVQTCNYCGYPCETDPVYCRSCKEYKIVPEWACETCLAACPDPMQA